MQQRICSPLQRFCRVGLLGVCGAVLLVGKSVPEPPVLRCRQSGRLAWVDPPLPPEWEQGLRLWDSSRGSWADVNLPLQPGRKLRLASFSPWIDSQGRRQVVALSSDLAGQGTSALWSGYRLVRLSFPDGEILNELTTPITPSGPPCWLGGTLARLIFAAGDNHLYRLDFERVGENERVVTIQQPRPIRLSWRAGPEPTRLHDIYRPTDPRLDGYLLATVTWTKGQGEFLPPLRLCWLKLDAHETSIVAAGPLSPDDFDPSADDRHFPVVARRPDGSLILAYLSRARGDQNCRLLVAPLQIDPRTGQPGISEAEAHGLARECLLAAPIPSIDGRRFWILRQRGERLLVGRADLDALAACEVAPPGTPVP